MNTVWGAGRGAVARRTALIAGVFAAFALAPQPGAAQAGRQVEPLDSRSSYSFGFDNDALFGTDRGYTGGASLTWMSGSVSGWRDHPWLTRIPGATDPDARTSVHATLGQSVFTPDDIRRIDLVLDDRPYAGLLFLSLGTLVRHSLHEDAMELTLGVVGPASQAERSQVFVHGMIDNTLPRGWEHQLENELVMQFSLERRWMGVTARGGKAWGLDIIPHLGGGAGNLAIYSSGGVHVRAGWNLPPDFGPGSIRPGGERWARSEERGDALSLQLHAGLDGKAVFRNLLLDGNTFRDSHRVVRIPLTSDAVIGVRASRGRFSVSYEMVYWTRRFTTESRDHNFSSLTLGFH